MSNPSFVGDMNAGNSKAAKSSRAEADDGASLACDREVKIPRYAPRFLIACSTGEYFSP
jgi:hypothetical protein